MKEISALQISVILCAVYCIAALLFLFRRSLSFGGKKDLSTPAGKGLNGIIYAFGRGMMPWEKESAGKHLPTFLGGIVYHSALLSALLFIFWDIFRLPWPSLLKNLFLFVWTAGFAAGIALLVKRFTSNMLRRLSCPDDFIANLSSDIFLALTVIASLKTEWKNIWYLYAALLFIYIPFGKIRHCFFFFITRIIFGRFFGRRGVFPGPGKGAER